MHSQNLKIRSMSTLLLLLQHLSHSVALKYYNVASISENIPTLFDKLHTIMCYLYVQVYLVTSCDILQQCLLNSQCRSSTIAFIIIILVRVYYIQTHVRRQIEGAGGVLHVKICLNIL
jgi:hypothetical protein